MVDKIHLTDDGNEALKNKLVQVIGNKSITE